MHESGTIRCYDRRSSHWGNGDWQHLVEQFTRRQVSMMKDRLYALQGLADIISKSRFGLYHFGLWSTDIPHQLSWICKGKFKSTKEVLPQVPSWSWMSLDGVVEFPEKMTLSLSGKALCQDQTITDSGVLKMKCYVDTLGVLQPYVKLKCKKASMLDRNKRMDLGSYFKQPDDLVASAWRMIIANKPSGIVVFDNGVVPAEPVYYSCLVAGSWTNYDSLFDTHSSDDEEFRHPAFPVTPVISILLLKQNAEGVFNRLGLGFMFEYGPPVCGYPGWKGALRDIEIH